MAEIATPSELAICRWELKIDVARAVSGTGIRAYTAVWIDTKTTPMLVPRANRSTDSTHSGVVVSVRAVAADASPVPTAPSTISRRGPDTGVQLPTEEVRHDHHSKGLGRLDEAGGHGRLAPQRLHVEGEEEQVAEEPGVGEHPGHVDDAEQALPQQPQVEHRVVDAKLDDDEQHQGRGGGGEHGDRHRGRPSPDPVRATTRTAGRRVRLRPAPAHRCRGAPLPARCARGATAPPGWWPRRRRGC